MKRIILYGFLAALFFSSTFVINKWLSVEQNSHWYWTATLRYLFVIVLLFLLILFRFGFLALKESIICYFRNFFFWIFTGGLGFGAFYLLLCYASKFSNGWVLATTWQSTILFTPLIIFLLGGKVNFKGVIYLFTMFIGVIMVNFDAFYGNSIQLFNSIVPILLAALLYPFGNTICKYACEGKYSKYPINTYTISKNPFCQILMMALGALPILICTGLVVQPDPPTTIQIKSVFLIAVTTGIIATYLLYKARLLAKDDNNALAFADGTQSLEAPLALIWEITIFKGNMPNTLGCIGIAMLFIGMILFYKSNIFKNRKSGVDMQSG